MVTTSVKVVTAKRTITSTAALSTATVTSMNTHTTYDTETRDSRQGFYYCHRVDDWGLLRDRYGYERSYDCYVTTVITSMETVAVAPSATFLSCMSLYISFSVSTSIYVNTNHQPDSQAAPHRTSSARATATGWTTCTSKPPQNRWAHRPYLRPTRRGAGCPPPALSSRGTAAAASSSARTHARPRRCLRCTRPLMTLVSWGPRSGTGIVVARGEIRFRDIGAGWWGGNTRQTSTQIHSYQLTRSRRAHLYVGHTNLWTIGFYIRYDILLGVMMYPAYHGYH